MRQQRTRQWQMPFGVVGLMVAGSPAAGEFRRSCRAPPRAILEKHEFHEPTLYDLAAVVVASQTPLRRFLHGGRGVQCCRNLLTISRSPAHALYPGPMVSRLPV